jgi:hypothetical protein
MSPQCQTVLDHIKRAGSITGVEAETCHKIRHLPSRIFEIKKSLRKGGQTIVAETKHDVTGQRYVRYSLAGKGVK